jgi:phosphate transport system ATP-binding protein
VIRALQDVAAAEYGARGGTGEALAQESPPAKIRVSRLHFYYGAVHALRDVNMSLMDRSITAFIGPSGCGKSTLLRVLNRMYSLYHGHRATGEVLLDGEDVLAPTVDVASLRYRVGMVFQKPTPFPMSVFDNVAFGLRLARRISRQELAERVEAALRDAALWDEVKGKLSQDGRSLSGGQQQRLCIARTVAVQPEVLLFDEPTAALDPISTLRIEETLQSLRERYCIAIVTHNLQQAARVSNVTAFMYLGELVEMGPTEQMFTAPQDRRTDDYVTGRFG